MCNIVYIPIVHCRFGVGSALTRFIHVRFIGKNGSLGGMSMEKQPRLKEHSVDKSLHFK